MVEFVHPGVLFALPLASLPIIIHLLNRRRYVTVRWAAMMYLQQAERQTRRRIRWQNLLVLLLRTLAVVLLVLLFARPVISSGLAGRHGARVVLLLDDSASMGAVTGGRSAWDRAREAALAAAGRVARGGGPLSVYMASAVEPGLAVEALGSGDLDTLASRLEEIDPTATALAPVVRLGRLLQETGGTEGPAQFIVVTDMQATEWADEPQAEALAERLAALRDRGGVTLVDVGGEARTAGIAGMRADGRLPYAGASHALRVVLASDFAARSGGAALNVALDGLALPAHAAPAVPAGQPRDALVQVLPAEPGYHYVEAEWRPAGPGDALSADNRRFHAFEAFEDPPVLVLADERLSADAGDPGIYVRTALRPGRSGAPGLRTEAPSRIAAGDRDLSGYAAVFACDLRSPAAWGDVLSRYVSSGGRLVIFLGRRAEPAAWQASWLAEDGPLPCVLGDIVGGDDFRLTDLDYGHALLQPFAGWDALFALPRFTAFRRLVAGEGVRVLARYDDPERTPAVVAASFGAGEGVLLNTSADDEWSDWPRSEGGRVTYVALVNWLAEQGAPSRLRPDLRLNLAAGERIRYALDVSRYRRVARLEPPSDSAVEAIRLQAGPEAGREGLWFVSPPVTVQGIWRLRLETTEGEASFVPFAVNIPDSERDLRRTSGGDLPGVEIVPWKRLAAEATAPSRYWPGVAAVLVVLLLAEGLLAFLFGRPGGGQGRAR
jgi:hypothetical protein